MLLKNLSDNWPKLVAILVLTAILFWGYGCPSRVDSLITDGKKVTRPELQIELDTIVSTAEFRLADLDRQDQFRDIVFQNVMLMAQTGTMNPAGIITLLLGIYGATRGAKDIKDRIEKKSANS